MVLRNEGEKFSYMGKEFTIGDKVLATCESEYEGLVGEIIEIRDGEDKETDNDTPDIYCRFAEPVMAVNKEDAQKAVELLNAMGEKAYVIGEVIEGNKEVEIC